VQLGGARGRRSAVQDGHGAWRPCGQGGHTQPLFVPCRTAGVACSWRSPTMPAPRPPVQKARPPWRARPRYRPCLGGARLQHVRYMCGTCAGPRCRQTLHGQGAARRAGARAGRAPARARRAKTGARLDEPSVTPRARGCAAVDGPALAPPRARAGWRRGRCAALWLAPAVERRSACLTPGRGEGVMRGKTLWQFAKRKAEALP
jgi:hypothetical protein